MATEHKLASGDVYKHGGTYYLAFRDEGGKWRSFVWGDKHMFETKHWWGDPGDLTPEFIINISPALNTVFGEENVL